MKKKLLGIAKFKPLRIFVLLSIGFSTLNLSCNEQTKKPVAEDKKDPVALVTTLDEFPVLYIPFQDITNAFNNAPGQQIRKIDFKFHFDGGVPNGQPTLIGYTARQNGTYIPTTPAITLIKADSSIKLAYPLNLSSIEFTRPEYNSLLNDPQNPPQQYLVFTPRKSVIYTNSVTYTTAWSSVKPTAAEIKILKIGDELKPSPPAPPYLQ